MRLVVIAAAYLGAAAGLVACGERTERDRAVTTQNAADAVVADIAEDAGDVTSEVRQEARQGAAVAGRELEQAGEQVQSATKAEDAERR